MPQQAAIGISNSHATLMQAVDFSVLKNSMPRTFRLIIFLATAALADASSAAGMLHTHQEFKDLIDSGRFAATDKECPHLKRLGIQTPVFPAGDRERATGGWVRLRILVNPDGSVAGSWPLASEPRGHFERATMAAVAYWRYEPCRIDGVAVGVQTEARFTFRWDDHAPRQNAPPDAAGATSQQQRDE